MLKVAITGNIAAGKSEFEKLLVKNGYMVVDADKITHDILEKDKETIEKIKLYFEDYDILEEDGSISRRKLGDVVFSNKALKYKLETILHPLITDRIKKYFDQFGKLPIIFVSVPILYEAGFQRMFDKVILVASDENLRLSRLLKRNEYTFDHAKARIRSQMTQDEKIDMADFVVYNNTSLANMEFQLNLIMKKLIKR